MSNSRKASTPATKKAAVPTKKAAPVRRALPAGARVQRSVTPVQTIGDLVSKELMAKQISSATTVTAKRVTGERVTISPLTAGIGLEPATNFDPSSISISQAAKAA